MKKYFLPCLFLLAFLIRVIVNVLHGFDLNTGGDDIQYQLLAESLLRGQYTLDGIHASAVRLPLFPLIIALISKIIGINYFAPRIFLSIIDLVIAYQLLRLGKKLANPAVGLLSCIVWLFNPLGIYYTLYYNTDILLTCLMLFVVEQTLNKRFVRAAVYLGLAALTKSIALLFLPVFCLYLFLKKINYKTIIHSIVVCVLILSPWIVYNYQAFHVLRAGDTGLGVVMWGAHNEKTLHSYQTYGTWNAIYSLDGYPQYAQLTDEQARSAYGLKKAIQAITQLAWQQLLLLEFMKLLYFFNFIPAISDHWSWAYAVFGLVSIGWALPFFFIKLVRLIKTKELLFIQLYIGYFIFVALITYGSIRLRMPVTPLIILFAVSQIQEMISSRHDS